MNTILKVAKAEWRNLFYSPVAWLVMLFFCIICGVKFAFPLDAYLRMQKFQFDIDPTWQGFNGVGLTKLLIVGPAGNLAENFFLFIPLLTMGVMNREVSNGTIKLLYSSPIRIRDIVIGKYLGLLSLILVLILFVATIFAIIPNLITDADVQQYISTVLALFLMANAYIAIGIFISSLTSYQIVAGVLTFVVFFILNSIGGLWQQYDFVRDLTYFLNIGGRADNLLGGLITTRDVCYFILITVLFLGFTLIKLKSTQESNSWKVSFKRYVGLFASVLLVGYLTSIPGKVLYWDTTGKQVNTIHPETQAVIKEMDGSPLTITLYTNLLGKNVESGLPQNRNFYVWKIWDKYRRFYPNMIFKYEYYYDVKDGDSSIYKQNPKMNLQQIRDKQAKVLGVRTSLFKEPQEIRKEIGYQEELMRLVMKLEYKGKAAWLRTYNDRSVWHYESHFAGSIKRLTRETPKILFTSGNYERSPVRLSKRDYSASTTSTLGRRALINHGVDTDTISLSSRDIPENTSILVVADPKSKLSPINEERIINYINKGGNALFLGEPNKIENLNPVLQKIGVELDEGIIVNVNKDEMPHIFDAWINDAGSFMSDEPPMNIYRLYKKNPVYSKIIGATGVSYKETAGFKIEPVMELKGDDNNWIERGHLVVDSAAPIFSVPEGDYRKEKYEVVVKMNRNINHKEQRIVVAGDADLLSDDRMDSHGVSYYSWLLNNKYPTYTNVAMPSDLFLKAEPRIIKSVIWTYAYIIPVLVLFSGIIILVRRKRK